ncbi:MAG: glycosyltransferase family 4 protein [Verrucomicrobia bacterium]|nr:glycosyltransferase family 4 protein [Verrucomicrobiota bacterium]
MTDGEPRRPWLAARTRRSLLAAGFVRIAEDPEVLSGEGPVLLVRAGQVLAKPRDFRPPPGGDRPLIGVGLPPSGEWGDFHAVHGGLYPAEHPLPPVLCEWHAGLESAKHRINGGLPEKECRIVHWTPLDLAATDERIAIYQIVTSLQHGGAEMIARELAMALPECGVAARLVVLGHPHRKPLEYPPGTLDLSGVPRSERAAALAVRAVADGVDLLHVHLTGVAATRELSASGIPVMASVHNTRAGWPGGWETLRKGDVALMIACSRAVENELREALPGIPVRTVWNGIRPNHFPETPMPSRDGGFTLACVANPRPQKRLHLLPAILAATDKALAAAGLTGIGARLVIAGETSPDLADAVEARALTDAEAVRLGVAERLRWTDGAVPVREVLADAHALVSCSAHEGLSLAHLEALSSGRPVVACDTGGTRELAWRNPAVILMDPDAPPEDFGAALAKVLLEPPPSAHRLVWRDFTTSRMAARVAMLARQVVSGHGATGEALWFVTNNLSTGGAQSSLRRLVKRIRSSGREVRVALLQEYPEHPTAGRLDLLDAGIPVFVPPPAGLIDPSDAVDRILSEMAVAQPGSVVFWNAITTHKLLLADALPFGKVFDISPGEMWFSSFDRCMENPPPGLPCRSAEDYGRLLETMVVKYHAEAARAAMLGAPVAVIPNGVEMPDGYGCKSPRSGPPVFGTAVRISPQKRIDELLDAFRIALPEISGAVLRIAGGVETGADECAAELREMAEGLPVEWMGELRGEALAGFHAECDVFVMISDPAGCPNASLEALAAGLPVIATDVGGASEQVLDGVNGRLVPARDIGAFARAMVDLAHDPERRQAMGDAAREHIRRHFMLERMTLDYLKLFCTDERI